MLWGFVIGLQSLTVGVPVGNFAVVQRQDPLTDKLQIEARVEDGDKRLAIRCDHNRSSTIYVTIEAGEPVAIAPSSFLEKMMPVDFRVDDLPADSEFGQYGDDFAMLEGPQARAFAQTIASGKKLFVRLRGLNGDDIDAYFNIDGAKSAIAQVAATCGDTRLQSRLAKLP